MQEWDSLSDDERRLYARMMEVYAAFLSHTDHHIGRLLAFLDELGELHNTLIFVVSDNGASAEGGPNGSVNENLFFNMLPDSLEQNLVMIDKLGGPNTYNHYPMGWTMAGNTPFRRWKRETFNGGISDPLIVNKPPSKTASQPPQLEKNQPCTPPDEHMVWIAGGAFLMGSDSHYLEEAPARRAGRAASR